MEKKHEKKRRRPKTRTRSVDFMRIEHARSGGTLTRFELLAQSELGVSPSALDLLIQGEERHEVDRREEIYREVLKKLKLTTRQQQCFESVVMKGVNAEKTGRALRVSAGTVRVNVRRVEAKLRKMTMRFLEGRKLKENPRFRLLTPREQRIFRLFYEELLGFSEIARLLGVRRPSVFEALKYVSEHKLKNRP